MLQMCKVYGIHGERGRPRIILSYINANSMNTTLKHHCPFLCFLWLLRFWQYNSKNHRRHSYRGFGKFWSRQKTPNQYITNIKFHFFTWHTQKSTI